MSNSFQAGQSDLLTTYLPATDTVASSILPVATNSPNWRNLLINGPYNLPRAKETNYQLHNRLTFIDILIRQAKKNCLLSCLLVATLFASLANTLLLSFVVKWIRSSDRELMIGKIKWDKDFDTTLFQLSTRVPDKSISLKSIESGEKPLRLQVLETNIQNSPNSLHSSNFRSPSHHQVFLNYEQAFPSKNSNHAVVAGYNSKSNYLAAVNVNSSESSKSRGGNRSIKIGLSKALEIETDFLVLYLLNDEQHKTNKITPQLAPLPINGTSANYKKVPTVIESGTKVTKKRLLELNARLLSISLPLETRINLNPLTSQTLIVTEEFKSSDIVGSLEGNLDVLSQNSSIVCESKQMLKLVSKSGPVKVTSSEDLNIKSPVLILDPRTHLYFQNGIRYFDSSDEIFKFSVQPQTNKNPHSSKNSMRAYNLVTINGAMMASE